MKRRTAKATKEKEREQSSEQKLLQGQGGISAAHSAASIQGQPKSFQPKLRDTVTTEKGKPRGQAVAFCIPKGLSI